MLQEMIFHLSAFMVLFQIMKEEVLNFEQTLWRRKYSIDTYSKRNLNLSMTKLIIFICSLLIRACYGDEITQRDCTTVSIVGGDFTETADSGSLSALTDHSHLTKYEVTTTTPSKPLIIRFDTSACDEDETTFNAGLIELDES